MKTNPFTSSSFVTIWSQHFNGGKQPEFFDFIKGVQFVKHRPSGVYVNAGKNLTKGIYYDIDEHAVDYKGKTFLVYDVPSYFKVPKFQAPSGSSLKVKSVFQYQGFLMDISEFSTSEDYIKAQFSSKNRREFRSNQRRLETCFDIRYEFFHGEISQAAFDTLFEQFHKLLSKRFADKQTNYHHLGKEKWQYYRALVFKMLHEKKASLLVIYNGKEPIGITLNFHAADVLFETITVFDPDYYKFSIGKTSIIKLLEWCFEHNYRISDFSKGDFDYKHKWSNVIYDFDYHILYDSKSLPSVLRAKYVQLFYQVKLYLRKKKVNEIYRRIRFFLKREHQAYVDKEHEHFSLETLEAFSDTDGYRTVDFQSETYSFLLQFIYTFLFANPEPVENLSVYEHQSKREYVIVGSKKCQKIKFL